MDNDLDLDQNCALPEGASDSTTISAFADASTTIESGSPHSDVLGSEETTTSDSFSFYEYFGITAGTDLTSTAATTTGSSDSDTTTDGSGDSGITATPDWDASFTTTDGFGDSGTTVAPGSGDDGMTTTTAINTTATHCPNTTNTINDATTAIDTVTTDSGIGASVSAFRRRSGHQVGAQWSKIGKNTDKTAYLIIHFPTSEGVSEVSERANE